MTPRILEIEGKINENYQYNWVGFNFTASFLRACLLPLQTPPLDIAVGYRGIATLFG
jgi:hypothetical protein